MDHHKHVEGERPGVRPVPLKADALADTEAFCEIEQLYAERAVADDEEEGLRKRRRDAGGGLLEFGHSLLRLQPGDDPDQRSLSPPVR